MTNNHDTTIDIVKVLIINIAGISLSFTNIELFLKITTLLITISYTVWKWRKDFLKDKKRDETTL